MLFSLSFALLFVVSTGMRFLAIRLDWIQSLSQQPESALTMLLAAAHWSLSLALYGGILLGMSFTVRDKVFAPAAILCIVVLGLGFTSGISFALDSWENVPPARSSARLLGGPGLILASSQRPSSMVIVLLDGPAEPGGARVLAIPGQPLQYQSEFAARDQSIINLPPVPFGGESPWFLRSLAIDLQLSAENLWRLFNEGFVPFLTYAGALVLLLCSLSFIFKFSAWPLASLFLGCLTFRGILALETFFNSPEMQNSFDSFLQDRLPISLVVPAIFCGVGLLAYLYSFLVFLAKRQGEYEN